MLNVFYNQKLSNLWIFPLKQFYRNISTYHQKNISPHMINEKYQITQIQNINIDFDSHLP